MKTAFLILIAIVSIGCQTIRESPRIVHEYNYHHSESQIVNTLVPIFARNGFEFIQHNENLHLLQASSAPYYSMILATEVRPVWTITFEKDKLTAVAFNHYTQGHAFKIYLGSRTRKDLNWYWDIREALNKLCENERVINLDPVKTK